jgi:hypothetical protein
MCLDFGSKNGGKQGGKSEPKAMATASSPLPKKHINTNKKSKLFRLLGSKLEAKIDAKTNIKRNQYLSAF